MSELSEVGKRIKILQGYGSGYLAAHSNINRSYTCNGAKQSAYRSALEAMSKGNITTRDVLEANIITAANGLVGYEDGKTGRSLQHQYNSLPSLDGESITRSRNFLDAMEEAPEPDEGSEYPQAPGITVSAGPTQTVTGPQTKPGTKLPPQNRTGVIGASNHTLASVPNIAEDSQFASSPSVQEPRGHQQQLRGDGTFPHEHMTKHIRLLERTNLSLLQQISDLDIERAEAVSTLDATRRELKQVREELSVLKGQRDHAELEVGQRNSKLKEHEETIGKQKEVIDNIQEQLFCRDLQVEALKQQLQDAVLAHSEASEEHTKLRVEIDRLEQGLRREITGRKEMIRAADRFNAESKAKDNRIANLQEQVNEFKVKRISYDPSGRNTRKQLEKERQARMAAEKRASNFQQQVGLLQKDLLTAQKTIGNIQKRTATGHGHHAPAVRAGIPTFSTLLNRAPSPSSPSATLYNDVEDENIVLKDELGEIRNKLHRLELASKGKETANPYQGESQDHRTPPGLCQPLPTAQAHTDHLGSQQSHAQELLMDASAADHSNWSTVE
eukprot:Clim_evm141s147 gene=Clim_evmTU141s147